WHRLEGGGKPPHSESRTYSFSVILRTMASASDRVSGLPPAVGSVTVQLSFWAQRTDFAFGPPGTHPARSAMVIISALSSFVNTLKVLVSPCTTVSVNGVGLG